jgi:hypothetical protein
VYDIFLYKGCKLLLAWDNLHVQISELDDLLLRKRFVESAPDFLGLALREISARALIMELGRAGAVGLHVPVAYRNPQVSLTQARELAVPAAAQTQAAHFPEYQFAPVTFLEEDVMWWIFFARSEELGLRGHIPGGFYVHIDKLDGHSWSSAELDQVLAILEEMQEQK